MALARDCGELERTGWGKDQDGPAEEGLVLWEEGMCRQRLGQIEWSLDRC